MKFFLYISLASLFSWQKLINCLNEDMGDKINPRHANGILLHEWEMTWAGEQGQVIDLKDDCTLALDFSGFVPQLEIELLRSNEA